MEKTRNGHLGCAVEETWEEFEKDLRKGLHVIENVHDNIERLDSHLSHLRKLDEISVRLRSINDSLLGSATSLDRVPARALWMQFALFSLTMILSAALLIVDRIKDSNTKVSVDGKGFSVEADK